MNKLAAGLITLATAFIIISTFNNLLLAAESPKADSSESFLTYNDTIYGISISYPSNWEPQEIGPELLISILENISNSEKQGLANNNEVASKVSDILEMFGLKDVSDVLGLNPIERSEFFKKMSQALNEGTFQIAVAIVSPPENESDVLFENMNIVVDNISAISPISLTDYVKANIEGMKVGYDNFRLVEPIKEIIVDGQPAISFVYTGTIGQTENQKNLQAYIIRGDTGYVLTFGAIPETYSVYAPTFERMLQSFKIKN
jgi:hypothetical protein